MKHIRVERCVDCPFFEKRIPRDGNVKWLGFCGVMPKYLILSKDPIHPDCPLEDDNTFALMAALELFIEAPHGLPLIQDSTEWCKAFYHAKAVLEKAKSARAE